MSLRSVHTTNLPDIFRQLGISLVVSTYQAGKLIVVRAEGTALNTHFRVYQKPMGIAVGQNKLAIGSAYQIWELHNIPAVGAKLQPAHDACYLPRHSHITGDIDIHEMAYGSEGLWFLNTRFSCLCSLDDTNSFVPRWRPPFVTAYDLSDRCHLNGLALVGGQPRYVTALGATDTPGGWRANKANGGLLMDIASNDILVRGLSMPHSPRWYRDTLWILESGCGTLAKVDPQRGTWQAVAQLPGFTRGIDFWGPLAFIGLSKIRETAVFSGLPITQQLSERICGVWVVNIETGETLGFLRFDEGVEEIFAVQVLPGAVYPEVLGDPRFADDDQHQLLSSSYTLPDAALQEIAAPAPLPVFQNGDRDPEPAITHFAVIVPVYNAEARGLEVLETTLASIETSRAHCLQHYPYRDQLILEIALVDDASSDSTAAYLKTWASQRPYAHVVTQPANQGVAAARNAGVAQSQAQAFFFCDADDRYLEPHILTGVQYLNRPLDPNLANPIYRLPSSYPAAVKTAIHMADPIHTYWQEQIKQSHSLNLCVRREAHDFIEGFPQAAAFKKHIYGGEDVAYGQWLTTFFSVIWLQDETVEYVRYADNHLDRQLERFQNPPNTVKEPLTTTQKQLERHKADVMAQHTRHLHQKFEQDYNTDRLIALGSEAHTRRDREQAAHYFRRCLDLDPSLKVARYNLGITYGDLDRWEEAEAELQIARKDDPNNAKIYNSLGFVCTNLCRLEEGVRYYQRAIELEPNFADAHMNLGMTYLKQGELKQGWAEFEWRWQTNQFTPFQCPHPRWQGEDIRDKRLLVHTEQGAGDSIQFARFLTLAARRCQSLLLVCPDHLTRLLQTVPGIERIYNAGDIPLSAFDTYCPLMSLPKCLGIDSLAAIPGDVPYLKVPPSELVVRRKEPTALHMGICWAGSPTQGNDRNRSTFLNDWLPLLKTPGVVWHSLQKGPTVTQIQDCPVPLVNWDAMLRDYADTAAIIQQLDYVITVDTSVAHVAGALAKPTWVLLCHNADWRWLEAGETSPYYPTLRLFRQTSRDWAPVFAEVKDALINLLDNPERPLA